MITMFGSHEVSDYEKWQTIFGKVMSQVAEQHGIQETKVYRTADSSRVVVTHTFSSREDAEKHLALMEDPDAQAMAVQNGSKLPLTVWLVEEVEV